LESEKIGVKLNFKILNITIFPNFDTFNKYNHSFLEKNDFTLIGNCRKWYATPSPAIAAAGGVVVFGDVYVHRHPCF
jgi:hypothetical protein